jgi:hypothetical protein
MRQSKSGLPAGDLGPPPAHSDQEKAPVMEELRLFAFKGVPDELQNPAKDKKTRRVGPERMEEDTGGENRERKHDQRDAQCVAETIDGVLMAAGILRHPLFAAASTEHERDYNGLVGDEEGSGDLVIVDI